MNFFRLSALKVLARLLPRNESDILRLCLTRIFRKDISTIAFPDAAGRRIMRLRTGFPFSN